MGPNKYNKNTENNNYTKNDENNKSTEWQWRIQQTTGARFRRRTFHVLIPMHKLMSTLHIEKRWQYGVVLPELY